MSTSETDAPAPSHRQVRPPRRGGTPFYPLLVLILLGSLALNFTGITWGLPNERSWSNDDITPDLPLEISSVWRSDWNKYPYLMPWIDRALYAVPIAYWRSTGQMDTGPDCRPPSDDDCYHRIHEQYGTLMLLSRVLRALMGTAIVAMGALLVRRIGAGPVAALLSAATLAVTQGLVFFSHVGNLDVPVTFFFAASLLAWSVLVERTDLRACVLFGAFGGAALATKEAIVGAYVLPSIALVVLAVVRWWAPRSSGVLHDRAGSIRAARGTPRAFTRVVALPLAAGLVTAVGVYVIANNVIFNPDGFAEHVRYWIVGSGIDPWNDEFQGHPWLAWAFVQSLAETMSWPLLLMVAVGTIAAVGLSAQRSRILWLLLPAASYYVFTISVVRYVYPRFTLPVVVVLAAVGATGLADAARPRRSDGPRWMRAVAIGVITVGLAHGLLYAAHLDLLLLRDARYDAERWITEHIPTTADLEVVGSRTYLPRTTWLEYDADRIDDEEFTVASFQAMGDDRPEWLILSQKGIEGLDGPQAELRDRLLRGDADYVLAARLSTRSGLEPFLIAPWTESRVSPTIWILRRSDVQPGG